MSKKKSATLVLSARWISHEPWNVFSDKRGNVATCRLLCWSPIDRLTRPVSCFRRASEAGWRGLWMRWNNVGGAHPYQVRVPQRRHPTGKWTLCSGGGRGRCAGVPRRYSTCGARGSMPGPGGSTLHTRTHTPCYLSLKLKHLEKETNI